MIDTALSLWFNIFKKKKKCFGCKKFHYLMHEWAFKFPAIAIYEEGPKKREFRHNFFISQYFYTKFLSPSKYSPLTTTHFCKRSFHRSNHFINSLIGMFFRPSSDFCFTSSTVAKRFPFMSLFNLGNKKKSQGSRSGE